MKKGVMQQEILLVTGSRFCQRQWYETSDSNSTQALTPAEQLKIACWNGLLFELLPELLVTSVSGKRLCLWYIRESGATLQIQLSEYPQRIEKRHSIDATLFLPAELFN